MNENNVQIETYSPLTLAFLGDAVYELEVRRYICSNGSCPSGVLHKRAVQYVCAAFQSKAYDKLLDFLNEEEVAVMKRGRNANGVAVPKSSSPKDYRKATGVEALYGYLFLKNEKLRIEQVSAYIFAE